MPAHARRRWRRRKRRSGSCWAGLAVPRSLSGSVSEIPRTTRRPCIYSAFVLLLKKVRGIAATVATEIHLPETGFRSQCHHRDRVHSIPDDSSRTALSMISSLPCMVTKVHHVAVMSLALRETTSLEAPWTRASVADCDKWVWCQRSILRVFRFGANRALIP